jgi:hypothetical protein
MKQFKQKSAIPLEYVAHGPQVHKTEHLYALYEKTLKRNIKQWLNAESANRFRTENDIMLTSLVAQHHALREGLAVWRHATPDDFVYVSVANWNNTLASDLNAIVSDPPKSFCVNDSSRTKDATSKILLREFLQDFTK